jgi:hypothetical protein
MVSDIFDEIYRMQEEMDRMFNEFMYPSFLFYSSEREILH